MLVFKNMFSFVLTFYAYDWLLQNGIRPAFLAISSIQMGVCALSIPMCRCFLLLLLVARGWTNIVSRYLREMESLILQPP